MGKHSKKKTENTRSLPPREEPKTRDPYEDWFGAAGKEQKQFYTAYVERCSGAGLDVFLVEYTRDEKLAKEIRNYCSEKGYRFYISEHVNLNPSE